MEYVKIVLIVLGCIIGAVVAFSVLWFLFAMLISTFVKNKDYKKDSKFYRGFLNFSFWMGFRFCNIKIDFEGKEKIKGYKKFLMVSNHRSNFDPIVSGYVFRKNKIAFISKPENFKNVPFFGKIIRRCCYRAIDRSNPKNALRTLVDAANLIKNENLSMGIYPEGTRSKSCVLLPFHDGVFKIAQKANVPIVVISIEGTENIHKNAPWKKTVVKMKILKVFDAETVLSMSSHELSDESRQLMLDELGK